MEKVSSAVIQSIDASTLTPIVQQVMRRDSVKVNTWKAVQLGGGAGNPVSVGLYRD
jgi:hypothetical protein